MSLRSGKMVVHIKLIIVFAFTLLFAASVYSEAYYMDAGGNDTTGDGSYDNPWQTLRYSVSQISGGDSLVIKNGTYNGTDNCLWQFSLPQNGTRDNFTTIRAEYDGGAVFEDGFINMNGFGFDRSYISFEGLKSLSETMIYGLNHIKFLRCSFTYDRYPEISPAAPLWIGNACSYILVEDCWAWGAGRYKFVTGGNHIVFRRCVARYDRTDWTDPMAHFSSYDGDNIAFQNCIAIDADHPEFWMNTSEIAGSYYIHHGAANNSVDSCISVNNANSWITGSPGPGLEIKNSLAIGIDNYGLSMRADNGGAGPYDIKNCTLINISNYGLDPWFGDANSVSARNNVLYGVLTAAMHGTNLGGPEQGYNVLYNNSVDFSGVAPAVTDYCVDNSNAIDPLDGIPGNGIPAILYPVRIEAGSDLDGTGYSGADRGANIVYWLGESGSFWGESGWNQTTNETLWPWPNEGRIKSDMKSYEYTGMTTNGTIGILSGDRGFAANGTGLYGGPITLTSYIWEYLGNPCPDEICTYDGSYSYADLNTDNIINISEVRYYISEWIGGSATIGGLTNVIEIWKNGGTY